MNDVEISGGFAVTGRGDWIGAEPAAETENRLWFASRNRPFLARLDLGERVSVVASKLLVAPRSARKRRGTVRPVPFSVRGAIPFLELETGWAVMATASRTARIVVGEDETLSVAPEAVVAWTGRRPNGFCPRLRLRDIFIPRKARLRLRFFGPCIVWTEGG